jgi:hypothetical protein
MLDSKMIERHTCSDPRTPVPDGLEQKKALEAKISREQGMLRERERKARTRRLIEYGGLVAIAALDEEDKGTVLGLLLEGARRLWVDAKARQRWKALGDHELAERAAHATAPAAQLRHDVTPQPETAEWSAEETASTFVEGTVATGGETAPKDA